MTASAVFPGWHRPTDLKWRALPTSTHFPGGERWIRTYVSRFEGLTTIVAWEVGLGWHLSISHPERYPTWNEIRDARYDLLPDEVTMGMLLPPRAEYVNLHPNCFHLHQIEARPWQRD